jgi:SHS2 domain-containing protein
VVLVKEALKEVRYKRFQIIEHTADAGIKAYGKTKEEMFKNAALGMFDIMANLKNIKLQECIDLEVEAENIEELLVAWLRELLYQAEAKKVLFKEFSFQYFNEVRLRALCYGERINPKKHRIKTEIKAVTYHQLQVKQENSLWIGRVIFDL